VVSEPLSICRFQVEEERVLELYGDCLQVGNSQGDRRENCRGRLEALSCRETTSPEG
jgi:hypothetical protein